jgi:predicted DNA-binding transcriptional regulator AlpA
MTTSSNHTLTAELTLLSASEIATILGVDRRTFFRWVARGQFPRGIRRGQRWVRWTQDDLRGYLDQLKSERS